MVAAINLHWILLNARLSTQQLHGEFPQFNQIRHTPAKFVFDWWHIEGMVLVLRNTKCRQPPY
jgi:hypothetical protein